MARRASSQPLLDSQGMLRFTPERQTQAFASLFVDPVGKRVGIAFTEEARPGSFQLRFPGGRPALYLESALQAAGIGTEPGPLVLSDDGALLIVNRNETRHPVEGAWAPFHCRSSAGIPMVSLDTRGTLTLDRHCLRLLNLNGAGSVDADYAPHSAEFTLHFHSEGLLSVRHVASHAEISLRGSLTSLGLALPAKRMRYTVRITGSLLHFSLRDPFLTTRPETGVRIRA